MKIISIKQFKFIFILLTSVYFFLTVEKILAIDARIGESMTYKILWMNLHAGDSIMYVADTTLQNGEIYYKLLTETKSSKYVSFFYPVKDRIMSIVDKKKFLPYKYEKILNEGNFKENKIIMFDYNKEEASSKKGKYKIPKWVQDPFSAIYYFRNLPLEVGKKISFAVFDGEKVFELLIKVLKKETIKVPAGNFKTIKIEPVVAGARGLFEHKGEFYVWVTDDEKKIPVLIKSGVLIGDISVQLVEYK